MFHWIKGRITRQAHVDVLSAQSLELFARHVMPAFRD
jgi:hypothetical protein